MTAISTRHGKRSSGGILLRAAHLCLRRYCLNYPYDAFCYEKSHQDARQGFDGYALQLLTEEGRLRRRTSEVGCA